MYLWNNIQVIKTYDAATTNIAMVGNELCVKMWGGLHFPISIVNVYIQ